ncbi:MAG: fatty acid desaturase [Bacteroidetes bacterium]|nr:fatty acid desaturase [Bacteroidota bacterium]
MLEKFNFEKQIEAELRKYKWIIPIATLFTAGLLLKGICICINGFRSAYYWTIIPAALMLHSFFIVVIHDGAHKAITRTKLDRFIMNIGAAFMLLPFYAEPFRKYHLFHHVNTNNDVDPLWPDFKKELYLKKRWLYILCELIPLIFTFILLLKGRKKNLGELKYHSSNQLSISIPFILFSTLISTAIIWYRLPPIGFILGTLFSVNIVKLLRHWCEHMGTKKNKESNTYWFPLGMGIGNHEAHHQYSHFSWITMMIGLYPRKKDTNPFKTLHGILFDKSFSHYNEIKQ